MQQIKEEKKNRFKTGVIFYEQLQELNKMFEETEETPNFLNDKKKITLGEVAEWSKALVLKTSEKFSSGVRIPPSPSIL